ncbi:MAG: glycosyltransferase involved in cell wall biosynthesis, partial [Planctomycetota bacterium]
GAADDAFLVGIVGRLAEVKCPERALEVFGQLDARFPKLEMVFIGDGEMRRELEKRIEGGGDSVQQRVHMIGARQQMPELLADLDAVLLTSRSEGMPVALIEAAAAGLPAVSTRVGGIPELIVHERTGFLAEDVDELAYYLGQLMEKPEDARGIGQRARLRVQKQHSAAALADRLEALYLAVAEEIA